MRKQMFNCLLLFAQDMSNFLLFDPEVLSHQTLISPRAWSQMNPEPKFHCFVHPVHEKVSFLEFKIVSNPVNPPFPSLQ